MPKQCRSKSSTAAYWAHVDPTILFSPYNIFTTWFFDDWDKMTLRWCYNLWITLYFFDQGGDEDRVKDAANLVTSGLLLCRIGPRQEQASFQVPTSANSIHRLSVAESWNPGSQCFGSVTFWYGSRSADLYLWLMDLAPDPALFFNDL
jgi:hypothetical protein